MNCRPGDLAVLIRSDFPENVGTLLQVLGTADCNRGEWRVSIMSRAMTDAGLQAAGTIGFALDADLRPIRPGDITDEEVRDLYAPKLPEAA